MSYYDPPNPNVITPFNSSYYAASDTSYVTLSYTNSTYYKKSGGAITGNIIASGYISISNTAVSTNSTTGAFRCAGGAYLGNDSLFAGDLTMTGANHHLYIKGANGGFDLQGANAQMLIANTTGSTSSSTGAFCCQGGGYFGGASLFNSTVGIDSTCRITGFSAPASGSGLELTYSANNTSSNILSYNRTGGAYLQLNLNDKWQITPTSNLIYGNTNNTSSTAFIDLLSNANNFSISLYGNGKSSIGSSATEFYYNSIGGHHWYSNSNTNFTLGTLMFELTRANVINMAAGLGTSAIINIGTTQGLYPLNINGTNGQHIYMPYQDSSTVYSLIGVDSSGSTNIKSCNGGTLSVTVLTKDNWISLRAGAQQPRYHVDLGAAADDVKICLFQSGSGGTYGIGANNQNMQYLSEGGYTFYNSTTNAGLTTLLTTISQTGLMTLNNSSLKIKNYEVPASSSGAGLEIGYIPSNYSYLLSYDRSGIGSRKDLLLNEKIYITGAGNTSIGYNADLGVVFGVNSTTSTQYVNATWSIFSDKRLKKDIENADLEICYNNIKNVPLRRFTWVDPFVDSDGVVDNNSVGFIADEMELVNPKSVHVTKHGDIIDCKTVNLSSHLMSLFGTSQLMMKKIEDQQKIIDKLISILTPAALNKFNNI